MNQIGLCELIEILDGHNRAHDFSRVVSMGSAYSNGSPIT